MDVFGKCLARDLIAIASAPPSSVLLSSLLLPSLSTSSSELTVSGSSMPVTNICNSFWFSEGTSSSALGWGQGTYPSFCSRSVGSDCSLLSFPAWIDGGHELTLVILGFLTGRKLNGSSDGRVLSASYACTKPG